MWKQLFRIDPVRLHYFDALIFVIDHVENLEDSSLTRAERLNHLLLRFLVSCWLPYACRPTSHIYPTIHIPQLGARATKTCWLLQIQRRHHPGLEPRPAVQDAQEPALRAEDQPLRWLLPQEQSEPGPSGLCEPTNRNNARRHTMPHLSRVTGPPL